MKIVLGCGQNHVEGWVNCDIAPEAKPDVLMDMERPWPFEDSSVEEALAIHVLEHIHNIENVWKEMYRVLKPDGSVFIAVPHPRHENFIGDPTHVRAFHQMQFTLLSKRNCEFWRKEGKANSPLALYWDVDFEIVGAPELVPDQKWAMLRPEPQRSPQQLQFDADIFNGVCSEIRVRLKAVKE